MPKRKQRQNIKKERKKKPKNNHQTEQKLQSAPKQSKPLSAAQFLAMSKITKEDEAVCAAIKKGLCDYLNLPPLAITNGELLSHMYHYLQTQCPLFTQLGLHSESELYALVKRLRSLYGMGSFVWYYLSPKHFFDRKFNFPQIYVLVGQINQDCIFGNVAYVPNALLTKMSIKSTPYDIDRNFLVTMLVCASPQNEINFVFYQSIGFLRQYKIKQFLKKDKWNTQTLRNQIPEFAKLFESENQTSTMKFMTDMNDSMVLDSLQSVVNIFIPQNIASSVTDSRKEKEIEKVTNHVHKQCEMNEAKYKSILSGKALKSIPIQDRLIVMLAEFPFINNAMKDLQSILGEKYDSLIREQLAKDGLFVYSKKMWKLTKRMEGRNCGFCNKKEIRSEEFNETFKKCKRCQSKWYCCSICQKKDWNAKHRHECKRLQIM